MSLTVTSAEDGAKARSLEPRWTRCLRAGLTVLLLLPCMAGAGQESTAGPDQPGQHEPGQPEEVPREENDATDAGDPSENTTDSTDPCDVREVGDEQWIDQFRREVFESVCESARWFDGFFGSRRFDEEARKTHGRVGLQLIYDEFEGVEVDGTLKVRVDFPNLDERVNAFLGRDDQKTFLTGADDGLDFFPSFFRQEGGEEWLLGLGYRPVSSDRGSFDLDVGIEVETPIDPFVSARYRYYWLPADDALVRARQTVYWTNQRDFGTGTRVDYERPLGSSTLGRAAAGVVWDGQTEGIDWDAGVTLFHGFSNDRAVSLFVGIDGETGRDVPIEDYGTRFTYRQRMLREWFFGEIIAGVTWPRDRLDQTRELAWHLGFGFEIYFSGEDLFSRDGSGD